MTLERRYRRLLWAYPRSYRARRGEEMLGTLLEAAPPEQRRPSRREAADLLAGGLRERLGLHALPRFDEGLRIAGPIGLVVATAATAADWATGNRAVASTVVAAVWVLALLGRELWPRLSGLPVLAWLVTMGALGADLAGLVPGSGLTVPAGFGLIAALGCVTTRPGPSTVERLATPGAVVVLVTASVLRVHSATVPSWPELSWLAPVAVLVFAALQPAAARSAALARSAWAAGVLLVATPLTVASLPMIGYYGQAAGVVGAAFLAGLFGVVVVMVVRQRTAEPAEHGAPPLAAVGSYSLGAAAGIGAGLIALGVGGLFGGHVLGGGVARGDLLVLALPVLAAAASLVARLRVPAAGVALAGLLALFVHGDITTVRPKLILIIALLLVVGATAGAERAPGRIVLGAAAAFGLIALSGTLEPPYEWPWYAADAQGTAAPLLAGIVLAPALGWAVYVMLQSRKVRARPAVVAVAAFVWLVIMTRPVALLDPRLLVGIAVGVAIAYLARLLRDRPAVAPMAVAVTEVQESSSTSPQS